MENGGSSRSGDISPWQSLHIPPFGDHILSSATSAISSQFSDIAQHFGAEVPDKFSTKNVIKVAEHLSHQICRYHMLVLGVGTTLDGEPLRKELADMQHLTCDMVTSVRLQLSDAFQKTDNLPKKDIVKLEKSCRVLVACIHMLDRELRRTLHLYRLFPLFPDPDNLRHTNFIETGLSHLLVYKSDTSLLSERHDHAEKYLREKDCWQELENDILDVHNLDVELHRDEVLGPVLDYLTLCPMGSGVSSMDEQRHFIGMMSELCHGLRFHPIAGLDDISSSSVSVSDVCTAIDPCLEDSASRKKSSLVCYIVAITAVVCIGSGVLMGVIFMIVY